MASSPRATPAARLLLSAVVLLGLALGFVALFHQDHQDDHPSTNHLPPIPAEALGFDHPAGTPSTSQAPQQALAASPSSDAAALSNTRTPAGAAVKDRDGSTNDAHQASSPSLFSALASMAAAGAAGGKQQQQQQQGLSPEAEAEAEEGGGFLSVVGCTPEDGEELRAMVEDSGCRVITLVPHTVYNITAPMAVRRPVAVVGRPLGLPTLDGHLSYRSFQVEAGGRLDLRYVRILRGRGRQVVPGYLTVVQGAIAYVERGGALSMSGCQITIHPSAVASVGVSSNPRMTTLLLGGGIFHEGGTLRLTGCVFYSVKPGIIWREKYFIGNEILILTGNVLITGCIFSSVVLFSNSIGVGGFVFNVAGNVIFTGCVFNSNGAFYQSSGIGYLSFNSAGLSIFTGCISNFQLGAAVFFGGGLGMFTGAGVTVMTGLIGNAEGALRAGAGMGFQSALGSGVVIRTGIIQNVHAAASFGCGIGHSQFIGAGTAVYTNILLARTTMLVAFYGVGGYLFCGSGSITITNTLSGLVNGIGITAGAGIGTMLLAGWLVRTNNLTVGISLILAVFGQGSDLMVLSGGAVLVFNRVVTRPPALLYFNPGLYGVWIAGNGFFLARPDMLVAVATHQGLWRLFLNTTATAIGGMHPHKGSLLRIEHMTYWTYKPPLPKKGQQQPPIGVPTPAPVPGPDLDAFLIGVPFFGGRERQRRRRFLSVVGGRQQGAEAAAAVGKYWAMNDASLYDAVLEGEEKEGEGDAVTRINRVVGGGNNSSASQQQQEQEQGQHGGVFIADEELAACSACDVGSAGGLAGPGADTCVVEPACPSSSSSSSNSKEGGRMRRIQEEMWVRPPGSDPANTSVAVLDLTVSSSSSDATTTLVVDAAAVAAAINATVRVLGLPERYHLRVVPPSAVLADEVFTKYDDEGVRDRRQRRRRMVEGEAEEEGDWSPRRFRAFVVSDWQNATGAVTRGLCSAQGAALLSQHLGRDPPLELQAKESLHLLVPGNGAGVFPGSTGGSSSMSSGSMGLLLDQEVPSALLYATATGHTHDTGAAEEEEEEEEALATEVRPGGAYVLVLDNFPPAQLLALRLTGEEDKSRLLGLVPSGGAGGKSVRWRWEVDGQGLAPGEYFIEVASARQDAFAYSQAFRVLE